MIGLPLLIATSLALPRDGSPAHERVAADLRKGIPAASPEPASSDRRLSKHHLAKARVSPVAGVRTANRLATLEPVRDGFLGSVQVYPWTEGGLYRLYAAPGRVSDITLEAGEHLNSVAAGDTVRWIMGDTESGTGTTRRKHILVKPTASGLRTNLVIATDRRVYHVDVESIPGPAMATISWTYPEDPLLGLHAHASAVRDEHHPSGIEVDALNFNYRIEGDAAPWRPLRAFDDGRQVFIEFPATLGQGEAPPLFARGASGRAELVNYRVRGRFYVVDRLFGEAELRLGEHRQRVVRIVREGRGS